MDRIRQIREELASSPVHLCPERATLITEFFKKHDDPSEPMVVRKARALHHLLTRKKVKIYRRCTNQISWLAQRRTANFCT